MSNSTIIKWSAIILNVFVALSGSVLLITSNTYTIFPQILLPIAIGFGTLLMFAGIVGCVGASIERCCLLKTSISFIFALLACQICFCAFIHNDYQVSRADAEHSLMFTKGDPEEKLNILLSSAAIIIFFEAVAACFTIALVVIIRRTNMKSKFTDSMVKLMVDGGKLRDMDSYMKTVIGIP